MLKRIKNFFCQSVCSIKNQLLKKLQNHIKIFEKVQESEVFMLLLLFIKVFGWLTFGWTFLGKFFNDFLNRHYYFLQEEEAFLRCFGNFEAKKVEMTLIHKCFLGLQYCKFRIYCLPPSYSPFLNKMSNFLHPNARAYSIERSTYKTHVPNLLFPLTIRPWTINTQTVGPYRIMWDPSVVCTTELYNHRAGRM
jgi:hypothetical protein